jgi:hypothetical protein
VVFARVPSHFNWPLLIFAFFLQQKCLRETYIVLFGSLMMQATADSLSIVYVNEIGVKCRDREQRPRENEGRSTGHKVLVYNPKDHFRAPNSHTHTDGKDKLLEWPDR